MINRFPAVLGLALLLLLSALETAAQTVPYPSIWRRGQSLPVGQSLFTFSSNLSSYSNQFSEQGKSVSVGSAYSQSITWRELLSDRGQPQGTNAQLRSYVANQGVNLNSVAATTELHVSQEVLNLSPQWAYGMTKNWMVGFRLPVIYRRTKINSSTQVSEEYEALAKKANPNQQAQLNSSEMNLRAKNALNRKLQESDYEPIETDQKEWLIGDVELMSKSKIWQSPDMLIALRQRAALPTASSKSPYRYIDSSEGDGQLDLGADLLWDYWFAKSWTLTVGAGYTWQSSDQIRARQERLSDEDGVDLEVNRKLGNYWTTNAFAEKNFGLQWKAFGGYSYFDKASDKYEGPEFQSLSENTKQQFHMAHIGLTYKATPFSERRERRTQLATSLYLSRIITGVNVPDTSLAGLDLQILF